MSRHQVNLTHLFADFSKAFDGFRTIISPDDSSPNQQPLSDSSIPNLFSGNVCFKTCGMEDIQDAAKKAADFFVTATTCITIMTVIMAICIIILTTTIVWFTVKRRNVNVNKQHLSTPLMNNSLINDSSIFESNPKPVPSHNTPNH